MSMPFQCPSCMKELYFSSGDSAFQTCRYCKGKIIVPSTVVNLEEMETAKPTEYALREQRDLKLAEIRNELNAGRKIEAIKTFRETFGSDLKTANDAIERLEANKNIKISKANLRANYSALQENTSPTALQNNPAQDEQPKIGQLIMTLIYIAIGIAIFFWLMD